VAINDFGEVAFHGRTGGIKAVFTQNYSIFDILFFRVSFSIRLAAFQASGGARMKLHEIQ